MVQIDIEKGGNPATRIFHLRGLPPVTPLQEPIAVGDAGLAHRLKMPALPVLFSKVQRATGRAIEAMRIGTLGEEGKKYNIIGIRLNAEQDWEKAEKPVFDTLTERLQNSTLFLPDMKLKFHECTQGDLESRVFPAITPQSVFDHNKAVGRNADNAIQIDSWDPEKGELRLILGEACSSSAGTDPSICSDLGRRSTERAITQGLKDAVPGISVYIQS